MSLFGRFKSAGPTGFGWKSTADDVLEGLDLTDRHMLVTGCNSGIGFETMRALAEHGASVFGAARTEEKAAEACADVDGEAEPVVCELAEPDSVRRCAAEVAGRDVALDAIICNAGIMALPELEQVHGFEKQFFVNHIGHFILVTELLDHLADDARIVAVSSEGHRAAPREGIEFDNLSGEEGYSAWRAYGHSKLANILMVKELAGWFEEEDTDRVAIAVHPGEIDTNLTRHMNVLLRAAWSALSPLLLKSAAQGAATQTFAAAHPAAADLNGAYLDDCNVAEPTKQAQDPGLAERLWEASEQIVESLKQ